MIRQIVSSNLILDVDTKSPLKRAFFVLLIFFGGWFICFKIQTFFYTHLGSLSFSLGLSGKTLIFLFQGIP